MRNSTNLFLFAASLFLFASNIHAQKSVFKFDAKWRLVTAEKAVFTRMAALDTNTLTFNGRVWNNYANGIQQMVGTYENGSKEGVFEVFYDNGNQLCKGNFRYNGPRGKWEFFWPNGNKKHLVRYDSLRAVILQSWDSLGTASVTNGSGKFKHTFFDARLQSNCTVEGRLDNSNKTGRWTCRDEQKNLLWEETYDNNIIKNGIQYQKEGQSKTFTVPISDNVLIPDFIELAEKFYVGDEKVLDEFPIFRRKGLQIQQVEKVYTPPTFKGGIRALSGFISVNLPSSDGTEIKGTVIVTFMVETDGTLHEIAIEKSVSKQLDDVALEIVKKMPNWIPAKLDGVAIKRRVKVPIAFQ